MSRQAGRERIEETFAALRTKNRKALIIYLMSGNPAPQFTERLVPAVFEAGADIVELGFPFSDPVADGPVIQAAGQKALPNLSDLPAFLEMVRNIRKKTDQPLVCMTYYNPIFRYGEEAFFKDGLEAGLDGLIIPDLPLVEAETWLEASGKNGIAPIFLEAPNSEDADAAAIAEASQGFIYLVSLKGVTGSDQGIGENLKERIARLRGLTDKPLAVGFGISTPEQAREIGAICDGIIVGSGIIARMEEANTPDGALEIAQQYVRSLREALDALP